MVHDQLTLKLPAGSTLQHVNRVSVALARTAQQLGWTMESVAPGGLASDLGPWVRRGEVQPRLVSMFWSDGLALIVGSYEVDLHRLGALLHEALAYDSTLAAPYFSHSDDFDLEDVPAEQREEVERTLHDRCVQAQWGGGAPSFEDDKSWDDEGAVACWRFVPTVPPLWTGERTIEVLQQLNDQRPPSMLEVEARFTSIHRREDHVMLVLDLQGEGQVQVHAEGFDAENPETDRLIQLSLECLERHLFRAELSEAVRPVRANTLQILRSVNPELDIAQIERLGLPNFASNDRPRYRVRFGGARAEETEFIAASIAGIESEAGFVDHMNRHLRDAHRSLLETRQQLERSHIEQQMYERLAAGAVDEAARHYQTLYAAYFEGRSDTLSLARQKVLELAKLYRLEVAP